MSDLGAAEVTIPLPATPDGRLARFVALTERKRELDAQLAEIAKERAPLMAAVARDFLDGGTQSIKRDGWNVHLKRELAVRVTDRPGLAERLRRDDALAFLLGVQAQRLESFVRECLTREDLGTWEIDEAKLPDALKGAIGMDEYHTVGCRRA